MPKGSNVILSTESWLSRKNPQHFTRFEFAENPNKIVDLVLPGSYEILRNSYV